MEVVLTKTLEWYCKKTTTFPLFDFYVFLQVIGLLDVFTPARSLEEFNDV